MSDTDQNETIRSENLIDFENSVNVLLVENYTNPQTNLIQTIVGTSGTTIYLRRDIFWI